MDEELKQTLINIGLQDLCPKFEDNFICDLDTLKELLKDEASFKEICPILGHRLKLKSLQFNDPHHNFEIPIDNSNTIIHDFSTTSADCVSLPSSSSTIEANSAQLTADDDAINPNNMKSFFILETSQIFKNNQDSAKPSSYQLLDLKSLLEESIYGRSLLAIYNLEGELDAKCQGYLCDIIVTHFLNNEPNRRLTTEDYKSLTREIKNVFPNENEAVYYIPPIKKRHHLDNKPGFAKGKLIDKFKNRLTFLRRAGIITSSRPASQNKLKPIVKESHSKSVNDCVTFLKNNFEPVDLVLENWRECYQYRTEFLTDPNNNLEAILREFPIIKKSCGHILISDDFKKRFSEQNGKIYDTFEKTFYALVKLKEKSISEPNLILLDVINSTEIQADSKHAVMLSMLSSLLPQKVNTSKKKKWNPSPNEIRDSLITLVKLPGDIESLIRERQNELKKSNLPSLPFSVVEGSSYTTIKKAYVSFQDCLYEVPSVLKAVDVCFQLYQVLGLRYPKQNEHVWLFIQRSMYELITTYDDIPNIIDIASKIKRRLVADGSTEQDNN